jgi:hypothetical protein
MKINMLNEKAVTITSQITMPDGLYLEIEDIRKNEVPVMSNTYVFMMGMALMSLFVSLSKLFNKNLVNTVTARSWS